MSSMMGYSGFGPAGSGNKSNKIAGYNQVAIPTMDPQTMQYRQSLLEGSQPGLQRGLSRLSGLAGGDESQFQALERPAFENFQRALGQIGSRYAGVGSGQMSARNSSAFQNETAGAAGDLAARLQAQRLDLQQNALSELLGLSKSLLSSSPYEYALMPKQRKRKWYESLFGAAAPIGGAALGGIFGGPAGAALGGSLGSNFGSAFLE